MSQENGPLILWYGGSEDAKHAIEGAAGLLAAIAANEEV